MRFDTCKAKFTNAAENIQLEREGEEDDEHRLDVQILDECISKPRFACYSQMLLALHGVPERSSNWLEGCPCHAALWDEEDTFTDRARKLHRIICPSLEARGSPAAVLVENNNRKYEGVQCCPCGGMRFPELCLQEHLNALDREAVQGLADLSESLVTWEPTPADMGLCLTEYQNGVDGLHSIVELKTVFFNQLPYTVGGLAVADEARAKAVTLSKQKRMNTNLF